MLKLPQKHTNDEKANGIIAQYLYSRACLFAKGFASSLEIAVIYWQIIWLAGISGNILRLVKDEIADYEDIREKEACKDDLAFCRAVSMFFPEHYPFEKMGKVFLGLQALLESEYEFVPELAMEYVMYSLIQARIEAADDLGIKTLDPISAQRDYVISILRKEYPDEPEISDDGEDLFISWREKLEKLEDLHYYENVYFGDIDFLHLDFF